MLDCEVAETALHNLCSIYALAHLVECGDARLHYCCVSDVFVLLVHKSHDGIFREVEGCVCIDIGLDSGEHLVVHVIGECRFRNLSVVINSLNSIEVSAGSESAEVAVDVAHGVETCLYCGPCLAVLLVGSVKAIEVVCRSHFVLFACSTLHCLTLHATHVECRSGGSLSCLRCGSERAAQSTDEEHAHAA